MARHLITSALPYVNAVKHLGNLVGSLLPADVHARFLRQQGHEVLFVCGTDEHGAPAELAAGTEPVAAFCDRLHAVQADQYRRLGLSFDRFGRTSAEATRRTTVEVYDRLVRNGLVERRTVTQLWSRADGRFLPDRYVLGTCPHCGSPDARGDQCEGCGRLLDPEDLVAPRSAISGAQDLVPRATEHAFLRLSALTDAVRAHVDAHPEWPALTRRVAGSWLADGLRDRCITRDLAWGTPVPDLPGKVFWCWFDAPLGYVGLTREADPDGWERWWDPAGDATITQFLGKDNLPFHTVWFPAVLRGAGGLRLPDRVCGFHWLSWYGDRFSTSRQRGVFLDKALELLPADVWRWALLAQAPETADSRFTWDQLARVVDKDLVGQLGNLLHRTQGLVARVGGRVPAGGTDGPEEARLRAEARVVVDALVRAHEDLRFRDVVEALRALLHATNRYVDRSAPWRTLGEPAGALALRTTLEHLRLVAAAVAPVIPDTAARLAAALHLDEDALRVPVARHLQPGGLEGRPVTPIPPLFARVDPIALAA